MRSEKEWVKVTKGNVWAFFLTWGRSLWTPFKTTASIKASDWKLHRKHPELFELQLWETSNTAMSLCDGAGGRDGGMELHLVFTAPDSAAFTARGQSEPFPDTETTWLPFYLWKCLLKTLIFQLFLTIYPNLDASDPYTKDIISYRCQNFDIKSETNWFSGWNSWNCLFLNWCINHFLLSFLIVLSIKSHKTVADTSSNILKSVYCNICQEKQQTLTLKLSNICHFAYKIHQKKRGVFTVLWQLVYNTC